jgi:hypothetical protein
MTLENYVHDVLNRKPAPLTEKSMLGSTSNTARSVAPSASPCKIKSPTLATRHYRYSLTLLALLLGCLLIFPKEVLSLASSSSEGCASASGTTLILLHAKSNVPHRMPTVFTVKIAPSMFLISSGTIRRSVAFPTKPSHRFGVRWRRALTRARGS